MNFSNEIADEWGDIWGAVRKREMEERERTAHMCIVWRVEQRNYIQTCDFMLSCSVR